MREKTIKVYACDYCEFVSVDNLRTEEHEEECPHNPSRKMCETCGFVAGPMYYSYRFQKACFECDVIPDEKADNGMGRCGPCEYHILKTSIDKIPKYIDKYRYFEP